MRNLKLLLLGLLVFSASCNVNQELVQGIKSLMGPDISINHLAHTCDGFTGYRHFDIPVSEIEAVAKSMESTTYLKKPHQVNLADSLRELIFGDKSVNLVVENQITASLSGSLTKAFVGVKNGDRIQASAVFGTVSCYMTQQKTAHSYQKCHRRWFRKKCHTVTDYIPRGFYPAELEQVKNSLQLSAAKNMFNELSAKTGVNLLFMNSEGNQYLESQKLKAFFPEVDYRYLMIKGVLLKDLASEITTSSRREISDAAILARITSISAANPAATFFYAPSNDVVYVLAIKKESEKFSIFKTIFRVPGKLPGGAFAYTTSTWIVENAGRAVEPTVQKLLTLFPASPVATA